MNILTRHSFFFILLMVMPFPALASVSVNAPAESADVSSPFKLSATAATCSSQAVAAMGYSFDSSSDTTIIDGTTIDENISAGSGNHTLHVKAWGEKGASCVTDVSITVKSGASSPDLIPPGAAHVSSIQAFGGWKATHDTGTNGKASGSMTTANSPSHSGTARKFVTKFTDNGGERYNVSFGDDEDATNFLYDGWVYIADGASTIGNIEMDLNQVMSNGHTVIFGFQCDGWSGTWDFTKNAGTVSKPKDVWVHSSQACNPRNWKVKTWHHVQITYSRTDAGVVTYKSVWLDDKEQKINAKVPSSFALGWGATILTNFQVDGRGSGTNTIYLDDLIIYRW
jgi:hypothetical protein